MDYIEQTTRAIRLFLVSGDPNIDRFTVLKKEICTWGEYQITFGILGESHFVTLAKDTTDTISEICACMNASFAGEDNITHIDSYLDDLTAEQTHVHPKNFFYTFSSKIEALDTGTTSFSTYHTNIGGTSPHHQKFIFPSNSSDLPEPVTEILIEEGKGQLIIHSIHTYPNEDKAVLTESSFKLV